MQGNGYSTRTPRGEVGRQFTLIQSWTSENANRTTAGHVEIPSFVPSVRVSGRLHTVAVGTASGVRTHSSVVEHSAYIRAVVGSNPSGYINMNARKLISPILLSTLVLNSSNIQPRTHPFTFGRMETLYKNFSIKQNKEFVICVYGQDTPTRYYQPYTTLADTENVEYADCTLTPDYLGTYHSHLTHLPEYLCTPSMFDIEAAQENNDKLLGIVCGDELGKIRLQTWKLNPNTK